MKKSTLILCMLCLLLLTAAGCAKKSPPVDESMPGGYGEDRKPEADELAMFESITGGLEAKYETTLVVTQVVAGTNYRFTAMETPADSNAKATKVYVYIYKPLEGEPELTEIEKLD